MTRLAQIFCLVAAVLIAAAPAMACCMTGQHEMPTNVISATPSCHEPAPVEHSKTDTSDTDDCPACDDCLALASSTDGEIPSITAGAADIHLLAVNAVQPRILPEQRYVQITGPPPRPDLYRQTPVTLKQRLII